MVPKVAAAMGAALGTGAFANFYLVECAATFSGISGLNFVFSDLTIEMPISQILYKLSTTYSDGSSQCALLLRPISVVSTTSSFILGVPFLRLVSHYIRMIMSVADMAIEPPISTSITPIIKPAWAPPY